jgi:hypothetical protein
MTVYVDNFRALVTDGRIRARWSHLTADTPDELHTFAQQLGLRRDWYQEKCKHGRCAPCPHWHYDVTDTKRQKAIDAGAKPIDLREMGALMSTRRAAMREASTR